MAKAPWARLTKFISPSVTAGPHEQQHAVGDTVEQDGEERGHGSETSKRWRDTKPATSSWPGLTRPSTPLSPQGRAWMPGSSPGMTWRERASASRSPHIRRHFLVLPESFTASKVANSTL